jgi:hypothetical protein
MLPVLFATVRQSVEIFDCFVQADWIVGASCLRRLLLRRLRRLLLRRLFLDWLSHTCV